MIPDGVPAVLSVEAAAAALNMDRRRLLGWVRTPGFVPAAFQVKPKGKYWIPAQAVLDLARNFLIEPDWAAAIDVDG